MLGLCVSKCFINLNAQNCGFEEVRSYLHSQDSNYHKQKHQADLNWWSYWRVNHEADFGFKPYNGVEGRGTCPKARIIIPVAVHVIHNGGAENISLAQAQNAIDAMNEHYANVLGASDPLAVNTGIQFALARFDRVQNALTVHKKPTETGQMMGLKMADADTFINIWVVKQILDANGNDIGVNGYATYPGNMFAGGRQGVVVRYNWFGNVETFGSPLHNRSYGDVLSHEVGHYLGLLHPFEGGCAGLDAGNAYAEGDLCMDVPAVTQADTNHAGYINTCRETYSLAPFGPNPPDQKQLFMDYTSPEYKTSFTNDQTKLMYARLEQYHPSLGSPLYMPAGYPTSCVSAAHIDGNTGACKGDEIKLSTYNLSSTGGNPTYSWKLYKGNTLVTTYNGGPNFSYTPDTGIYSLYLQVTNDGKKTYDTIRSQIEVLDCSKKLASTKGNWEFAQLAGLRFTPTKGIRDLGPSTNTSSSAPNINAPENSACMSDSLGNLLFYAAPAPTNSFLDKNGSLRVWGKNYIEIQGSPLDSVNLTAIQAALIVPYPDSTGKYYLLYNTQNADFCYLAVVDPRDSGTNSFGKRYYGRVTRKNDFITLPDSVFGSNAQCGEVLSAVPQCNPKYHWLLLHNKTDGKLGVFNIATGEPSYHSYFATSFTGYELQAIFNTQGTKFHFGTNIYNFDRSTGTISLHKQLGIPNLDKVWGAMWSADGQVLYRTEGFNNGDFFIYQYDLQSGDTLLNRTLIDKSATYKVMQLGPDGRIYIATDNQPYLAEVQNPNAMNYSSANDCKYEPVGVLLKKGTSGGTSNWASLPNLINAEKEVIDKAKITFTTINKNCKTVIVEPNICCASSYKWLWGDGQTSTGRTATHTYSNTGIYTIGLVINGTDTVYKQDTAQFTAAHKVLNGRDTVCNNAQLQEFSTVFRTIYTYQWKITNGSISSTDGNRMGVFPGIGNSTVKVITTNSRNGCKDSATKTLVVPPPVANNLIDSSQILCNTGQLQNITGQTPTGGNGTYGYTWWIQPHANGVWRKLSSTGHSLTAINNDSSYKYVRMVKSGTCTYPSNHLSKIWIADLAKFQKRDSSCSIILETVNANNFGISVSYQWQKSEDSIIWSNVSGATGTSYIVNRVSVSGYIRLKVNASNCTVYSAGYKPLPEFTIIEQPKDLAISGDMSGYLNCTVKNNYNGQIKYQWQKYSVSLNGWTNIPNEKHYDILLNAQNVLHNEQYRCNIQNACGQTLTRESTVKKVTGPQIITIDSIKSSTSGTPIKLKCQWTGERNVCYAVWQRSKNPVGGNWDSVGMTIEDSFTVIPEFTRCSQKQYYRVVLRNLCKPSYDTAYWTKFKGAPISKSIEVGSYQNPSNYADLWIPDSRGDRFVNTGAEPNIPDSNNYTGSYYLWNRIYLTKGVLVNDWKDRENVQCDRDTNFIHTMVYNRGNTRSDGGKVYFYWTVMSINEDWKYSWTGLADRKNPGNNLRYKLGNRINKTGVDIDAEAIKKWGIPGIPPGDSLMITYAWVQADTSPQNHWYGGVVNGQVRYAHEVGMCLLARIQECESESFGMTYPEKIALSNNAPGGAITYNGNIGYNITHNNNITSANFRLAYMTYPNSDTTQSWTLGAPPPSDDTNHIVPVYYTLCTDEPNFYTNAEFVFNVTDDFWNVFDSMSRPGNGFYSINNNEIVITDPCATIGPVYLPDTILPMFGMNVRYKPGSNPNGTPIDAKFDFKQFKLDGTMVGMASYGVHSVSNSMGNQGGGPGAPQSNVIEANDSSIRLTVNPNPALESTMVEYYSTPYTFVTIELYNNLGKVLKVLYSGNTDEQGKIECILDVNDFPAGIYIVQSNQAGVKQQQKVVVVK